MCSTKPSHRYPCLLSLSLSSLSFSPPRTRTRTPITTPKNKRNPHNHHLSFILFLSSPNFHLHRYQLSILHSPFHNHLQKKLTVNSNVKPHRQPFANDVADHLLRRSSTTASKSPSHYYPSLSPAFPQSPNLRRVARTAPTTKPAAQKANCRAFYPSRRHTLARNSVCRRYGLCFYATAATAAKAGTTTVVDCRAAANVGKKYAYSNTNGKAETNAND